MKAVILSLGVAALLTGPAMQVFAAPARQAATKPSDNTLIGRIENRIEEDATLNKYDIDVDVKNGVVTLSGTVATSAQKAKAAQDAKIAGVARVDNKLVVDPAANRKGTSGTLDNAADKTKEATSKAVDKTKEATEKAIDKTTEATGKAAEKTKEGLSKTGEVITDAWITTRVNSGFVGVDVLKDSDIDVDTSNHVVTLKGRVASSAGRARAVEIAKKVEGVRQVVNRLTVGPKVNE